MADPVPMPDGLTVDAVDWLPSGARSGLVRVRGRRTGGGRPAPPGLPDLVLETGGTPERFGSLPDPRSERDLSGWRGAYVVDASVAAAARAWVLEWPDGTRTLLEAPEMPVPTAAPAAPRPASAGGEVVDRAVLAERRARRAEAAEQAQARIAREALRAVEVLELRANEVEERLRQAQAERDDLVQRLAEIEEPDATAPDPAVEAALREEVERLRAQVERLRAEVARLEAEPPPAPPPPTDVVRRAARMQEALTSSVATIAELRLQIHEAEVARRTREVEWGAEAVRLSVLEREHAEARGALEDAREAEREAVRQLEEARAAAAGAAAAHDETRRRFAERVAELRGARQRIAELETELGAVRAQAERTEALEAARAALEAEVAAREEAVEAAAGARIAAAEERVAMLEGRLASAEAALEDAGIARELAEARALAADAARRAAEVAHAASLDAVRRGAAPSAPAATPPPPAPGEPSPAGTPAPSPPDPFAAAAERLRAATAPPAAADTAPAPAPPPAPDDVIAAAAAQVRVAAERSDAGNGPERARIVADLDAAADTLRRRATIVSAPGAPPSDVARGRTAREYPPLRGSLVKLAHDDPAAGAKLIAGLLPAQHRLVTEPLDYDLTIEELGTFAVATGGSQTTAAFVPGPRGRRAAAFHLRADAVTVAEMLAGVGPRPRRLRGRARISGIARRARALESLAGQGLGLEDAVRAGAVLDPLLALRCFAYAVHPAWTRGHGFHVEVRVGETTAHLVARDGGGLAVDGDPAGRGPDARVELTGSEFAGVLTDEPGARAFSVEGDRAPVDELLRWFDRARGRAA